MTDLAGAVALVTGASSGIGRACALALGAAGTAVGVNYRGNAEGAKEVVERIRSAGGRAHSVQADVADETQVRDMFAEVQDAFGTLDLLVSNAGKQQDADLLDMTLDAWQSVLDTNLRGAFLCAREAARVYCRRAGDGPPGGAIGNMIFVSSVHDRIPWAGHVNYASSKGGLKMLVRTLAQELGPSKVRVNAVAPGAIRTRINRESWEDEEAHRQLLEVIPYGRIGEPEDVARAVCWLASDDSDYVHGHILYVDGGMTAYPSFAPTD